MTTTESHFIDVVFDGPPEAISGRFVEVENPAGASIRVGEWIDRQNGFWALRIPQPTPRVLGGDPADIEDLLEALPVGSIVESSAEPVRDQEARIWVRESNPHMLGHIAWRGTGHVTLHGSSYLAKYCAPLTVIA